MPEAVTQRLRVGSESRRTFDQTLALRFPRVATALLRAGYQLLARMPPDSRLRRAIVRNYARRATEALNRGDVDLFRVYAHAEIEAVNTAGLVALGGFEAQTRGRDAFIEAERRWEGQWESFRYDPDRIIDFGDHRYLLLGRVKAHGGTSGVVVDSEWGLLARMEDGLLIREENFLDHAEALQAAGLDAV